MDKMFKSNQQQKTKMTIHSLHRETTKLTTNRIYNSSSKQGDAFDSMLTNKIINLKPVQKVSVSPNERMDKLEKMQKTKFKNLGEINEINFNEKNKFVNMHPVSPKLRKYMRLAQDPAHHIVAFKSARITGPESHKELIEENLKSQL